MRQLRGAGRVERVHVLSGVATRAIALLYLGLLLMTWTPKAPMPTARCNVAAASGSNGRIFVFGGAVGGTGSLDTVEIYDPSTDTWEGAAPLNRGRYNLAAAGAIDGRIYAMGGFSDFEYTATVEVHDPNTGGWAFAPSMRSPREGLGAARGGDDRIHTIGGLYRPFVLNTVEAYLP